MAPCFNTNQLVEHGCRVQLVEFIFQVYKPNISLAFGYPIGSITLHNSPLVLNAGRGAS